MKRLVVSVCTVLLSACGGGGGGATTSSTGIPASMQGVLAADGSAMSYGKVSINSLVDGTTAVGISDTNGNFPIPTSGVTYPAIVRVQSSSGNKSNYGYIAASSQAAAPVTPLTTLVLSIASGGNPDRITSTAQLSSANISAAKSAVKAIFSNIFSAFSVAQDSDLLTTNFQTNHTGIDLILDALNIKFDATGNPTICTKIRNACRTLDLANLDTAALTITPTEIASLNSVPIASCSLVIHSLTSDRMTSDTSLYAPDFLNSGLDTRGYMQALTNRFSGLAAAFNNPVYVGNDSNDNHVFRFDYYNTVANEYAGSLTIPFKLSGNGECVIAGDQLPFAVQVTSQITLQSRLDGSSNPAVTTVNPIRGLLFRAGGDGFGGTTVQNTVRVDGLDVTVSKLEFYMCDSGNVCSNKLIEMVKGFSNNGYYYTPGNVNTIPSISYSSAGINTPADFYNGNPNPILVKMKDASDNLLKQVFIKVRGGYITSAEMGAISLPSVTNAQTILSDQGTVTNPTLNFEIPVGITVQGVSVSSGMVTGQVSSKSRFVLSSTAQSTQVDCSISGSSDYRSIQMSAATTGGTPISIKYVWSPSCTGCT